MPEPSAPVSEALAALRISEKNFRELAEKSLQGVLITQDGQLAYVNDAMAQLQGYSTAELYTMSIHELAALVHLDDRAIAAERRRKRQAGEHVEPYVELRIVRKDGTVRWMREYSNPIEFNGKPGPDDEHRRDRPAGERAPPARDDRGE